jgi:hypothetical protein
MGVVHIESGKSWLPSNNCWLTTLATAAAALAATGGALGMTAQGAHKRLSVATASAVIGDETPS